MFITLGGNQIFMKFCPGMATANQSYWLMTLTGRYLKRTDVDVTLAPCQQQAQDICGAMKMAINAWKKFKGLLLPREIWQKISGSWPFNSAGSYFPKGAVEDLRGFPTMVTNVN